MGQTCANRVSDDKMDSLGKVFVNDIFQRLQIITNTILGLRENMMVNIHELTELPRWMKKGEN